MPFFSTFVAWGTHGVLNVPLIKLDCGTRRDVSLDARKVDEGRGDLDCVFSGVGRHGVGEVVRGGGVDVDAVHIDAADRCCGTQWSQ